MGKIAVKANIKIYNTFLDEMEKHQLGFDDAIQFYVAKKLKAKIITLDRDLHLLSKIKAIEPLVFIKENEKIKTKNNGG